MAKRTNKKTTKPKSRPRIDYELAAECLVYAIFHGDEAAAKKYNRSVRTIQRYRTISAKDSELSGAVAYKVSRLNANDWPRQIEETISGALEAVKQACIKLDLTKPSSLEAVTMALQVLFDHQLAMKMLNARTEENSTITETNRPVGAFSPGIGQA